MCTKTTTTFLSQLKKANEWAMSELMSEQLLVRLTNRTDQGKCTHQWVNNCWWGWQNRTDLGKCTHQCDKTQGHITTQRSRPENGIFWWYKKIDKQQKKKEAKKRNNKKELIYSYIVFCCCCICLFVCFCLVLHQLLLVCPPLSFFLLLLSVCLFAPEEDSFGRKRLRTVVSFCFVASP